MPASISVGIVIPARDAAPWIGDAIGSVRAQSHANWRLVVVDDGSTDATAALVAAYLDPRVRLIHQAPAGVSAARNRGIAALGDVEAVLFLDADDWLAPDALARLTAALRAEPDAVAAVGPYAFVSEHAKPGARARHVRQCPEGDLLVRLAERNFFANGGHLLVRATATRAAGRFREKLRYGEDWEYWVRLAALGPFAASRGRAPLLFVRRRANGTYLRLAADPASFGPCMAAILANPALRARLGPEGLAALHQRAEAEAAWVIGRALLRQGKAAEGSGWVFRSVAARPRPRRITLLAVLLLKAGIARLAGRFTAGTLRHSHGWSVR